ncbi:hypothetical protein L7F22_012045 [Adiantum nelumboides]|nr:hypothetical protein [Adiantum nelumboides]
MTEVSPEEEEAQSMLGEGEDCKCERKQAHPQVLQVFKTKAVTLDEVSKKVAEILQLQVFEWNKEKERLLNLTSDYEMKSLATEEEVQLLHERLSAADCAVDQLTKIRVSLHDEILQTQSEMEHAAPLIQKVEEGEIGSMSAALHAKTIALENAEASLVDKERIIHELSGQLCSLQDVQEQHALMQQECSNKTITLQTLSESHYSLKKHLQALMEGHDQEIDSFNHKLQEALDSHASKDLEVEAIVSEVGRLQLALDDVKGIKNKAELHCSELEKDLDTVKEDRRNNQLLLEKSVEEVAVLREALKAKDALTEKHRIQKIDQEKAQQKMIESLQQQLEECKSAERELLLSLEKEQRTVMAVEDLRGKELKSAKLEESYWKDEREKLIIELSEMRDLIELQRAHEQELEGKLLRADDAIRQTLASRTVLQGEISRLELQLQEMQMQLSNAESALELLNKSKKDELMSLSTTLHARLMDLETSRQEIEQHQKTITALSDDATKSQELQEKVTSLEKALKVKEEELCALSLSQERSKLQLMALQEEHHRDSDDLVVQLEKALECKSKTEKKLEESQTKLGCLEIALQKATVSTAELETELKALQESLGRLQEENCSLQHSLQQEERARRETESLKESMNRKENDLKELNQHIADVEVKLSHAMLHEQKWHEEVAKCEALKGEMKQKDRLHTELLGLHQKEGLHWSEKESKWLSEMETLMSRVQNAEENLTVTGDQLQTARCDLQCLSAKYKDCEQKVASCQEEITQVQSKLDDSNMQLHFKEEELRNLQNKLNVTSSSLRELSQLKDTALSEAEIKIDNLESAMQVKCTELAACANQIEALKKDSNLYKEQVRELEGAVVHLKQSLLKKAEEISGMTVIKETVESSLLNTREELMRAKGESELQVGMLKDKLSALEKTLHLRLESMQKKDKEMELLLTNLEVKDMTIEGLRSSNQGLVEEKEMLNQSVNALHAKVQMLTMEMEAQKSVSKDLCVCVEEKDRTNASLCDELNNLQHLLNLSKSNSEKAIKNEEKLKCLEGELAETSVLLRETEEKLSASEWAVQQLANEVAKAKRSLAQKERDEVLLQSRLSDIDTRSKAKERELVELDRHVQSLVNKNSHKRTEMERLTQAVEKLNSKGDEWNAERKKLSSEMRQMGIILDAKNSELAHLEEQLKQSHSKETMMEDAVQCLKSQLASQVHLSNDRESETAQFLEELETARTREVLMVRSLNEAENKLQQADQRFKEEIQKLNKVLKETLEKVSSLLVKNSHLERDLLASMEVIEKQKEKICTESEIAAAREISLKDFKWKFDSLHEELAEQKKLTTHSNEELTCTKAQLVLYNDTVVRLNEKICLLNEEMEDLKKTFANQLASLNAEVSLKDEEIQRFEVVGETMSTMAAESKALNDEVIKLKKEAELSSVSIKDRDAQIVRLKQVRKGLEAEEVKLREDRLKREKDLKTTLVQLESAEKKCSALEDKLRVLDGELANASVQLRSQLQETSLLVASNTALKEELHVKENMLKAIDLQSKNELGSVKSKLDDCCRKEVAIRAQVIVLLKMMRETLDLSRQHEVEGIQPLASEIFQILMQISADGYAKTDFYQRELARLNKSTEQLYLAPVCSEEFELVEMILHLQELEIEEQRRWKTEANVLEMARDALLKVKEQDLQGLRIELEALKKREDTWATWIKEVVEDQLGLENELSVLNSLTCTTVQSCLAISSPEARDFSKELNQLSERWKSIINALKEVALSVLRLLKEEFASSVCEIDAAGEASSSAGSWPQELQSELIQVKQFVKSLVHEKRQKDNALADSAKTVENLQSNLQENVAKEKGTRELISSLQTALMNVQRVLNKDEGTNQHLSISNLHIDMESRESALGKACLQEDNSSMSELEKAILVAEVLNRDVKFKLEVNNTELLRLSQEAERARKINNSLSEQLVELSDSFVKKELCMGGELQDVRDKVKSIEEEASRLRLQLRKASELTSHLEHKADEEKEELARVQVQMTNLSVNLELEAERNRDLTVKLAVANKQIEGLNLNLGLLAKEQVSMQVDIGKWKESASLAHDEKLALLSELHRASQSTAEAIKRLEAEKHDLRIEVSFWKEKSESQIHDNDLLKLQVEKYIQTLEDLRGSLRAVQDENELLQSTCQKLKADLISTQDASQQQGVLLDDALKEIQQGSRQSRLTIESRLKVLYEAMTNDNHGDNFLSLKTGSLSFDKEGTSLHQAINDDNRSSKDAALSSARSLWSEGPDSFKDLDHYLEICDSLIRRHAQLEKTLENLETSNILEQDQQHKKVEDARVADVSENQKKRVFTTVEDEWQGKEGTRKPLQPIVPVGSQAVMASTPSPCAKRRRSNDSFQDQNCSQ